MALSKARNRERMRRLRAGVQPIPLLDATSNVQPNPKPVRTKPSPLPNCPDGRYRPTDADGNPIYEYWLSEGKE